MRIGINFSFHQDAAAVVKFFDSKGLSNHPNYRSGEHAVRFEVVAIKGSQNTNYAPGDTHIKDGFVLTAPRLILPVREALIPVAGRNATVTPDVATINGVQVSRADVEKVLNQMNQLRR